MAKVEKFIVNKSDNRNPGYAHTFPKTEYSFSQNKNTFCNSKTKVRKLSWIVEIPNVLFDFAFSFLQMLSGATN